MERKECWYSVVRYCKDVTAGELINVGLILHSVTDKHILRYRLLDENNVKIKSISNSKVDLDIYKVNKDYLDYLLDVMTSTLFDNSPESSQFMSAYEHKFLSDIYNKLTNEKMHISEPTFAKTSNVDQLFDHLFATYIGSKFMVTEQVNLNVKKNPKKYV